MMQSNPFSMLMNMMNQRQGFNQMNPMNNNSQKIPLNQQQFKQYLPNIDNNILQQLAQQARNQGIPDSDIQAGLNFINQLK